MYALFLRQSDFGLQETEGGFRTQVYTATDPADMDYDAVRAELNCEVERFTNVGSGWTLTAVLRFVIRIGQYRPLVGSSFIPTPASLVAKRANDGVVHVCLHCVHPFTSPRAFEEHLPDCSKHVFQVTKYPEPQSDESIVKWKSREKTEREPFVIYADFESCLVPVHDESNVLDEHVPSGFCAYTVSIDPEFETEPVTYSGRDCMTVFYDHLAGEQH
jgi:hypothetical protein